MSKAMSSKRRQARIEKAQQLWQSLPTAKLALPLFFGFMSKRAASSGNTTINQDGALVQVLESHGEEDKHFGIQEAFLKAIKNAKHKICIVQKRIVFFSCFLMC